MSEPKIDAAIIYCRVSGKKQEVSGSGKESQEHRCRQYAATLGLPVEAVFGDTKTAYGDFMKRKGMVGVVNHLKANQRKRYIVIFDDLKRFARDIEFHWTLRRTLALYNAVPYCLNFRIEETPEGRFFETIVAASGELERHQLGRQAMQKSKARVEQGYAVTRAPIGYCYPEVKGNGHLLYPNEPFASVVREALEGFASRRFETQAEVQRFLESHPEWPRAGSGKRANRVNETHVTAMLKRPLYAGLVSAPHWDVSQRKGVHEALISIETHHRILERLNGDKRAPARKDLSADFALRGFVQCTCGCSLTASWSKGKMGTQYPYYLCYNRQCEQYGKSIRRDKIEGEFEAMIRKLGMSDGVFRGCVAMFKRGWEMRRSESKKRVAAMRVELADIERQMSVLVERIIDTSSPIVIEALEKRIEALNANKLLLAEKIGNSGQPVRSFEDSLRTSLEFLANPWKLWTLGPFDCKRTVLKLAFSTCPQYDRNQGFRTPDLALPFKMLADLASPLTGMVLPVRIELTTSALPRMRSTTELRQPTRCGAKAPAPPEPGV
jgi:site-specific DNA recombinase